MKNRELISIVIPVYNTERFLVECLDSIIKQTYNNLQVIIVDDGSVDTSGEIAARYAEKDRRLTVVQIENAGVSAARNIALDLVYGAYVSFIDSDDAVHPNYLRDLYERAKQNSSEVVCCGYEYRDQSIRYKHNDFTTLQNTRESFIEHLLKNTGGTIGAKLFKFSIIKDNNLRFDSTMKMREDLMFSLEYSFYAHKFSVINNNFYYYNGTNEESLSKEDSTKIRLQVHKIVSETLVKNHFPLYIQNRIMNLRLKEILFAGIRENMCAKKPIHSLYKFYRNEDIKKCILKTKISNSKDLILYAPAKLRSPLLTYFIYRAIYGTK